MKQTFIAIFFFLNSLYADRYDWPCGSHDVEGTYFQDSEKIIHTENASSLYVQWFKGGYAVVASPTVVSGKVYYGDTKGRIHATQIDDGGEVWKSKISSTSLTTSPTLVDDRLYISGHKPVTNDTQESSHLLEIKRRSGSEGWKAYAEGGDPIPLFEHAPVYDKDLLIVGTSSKEALEEKTSYKFQGSLYAFDEKTGFLHWRYRCTDLTAGEGAGVDVCGTPSLDSSLGYLYVLTGHSYEEPVSNRSCSLLCLNYLTNKRDGELVWRYTFDSKSCWNKKRTEETFWGVRGTPLLFKSGSKRFVGIGNNKHMYHAFDRKTGLLVWSVSLLANQHHPLPIGSCSAAYDGESIYACGNYQTGGGSFGKLLTKPLTEEKEKQLLRLLTQECKSTVTAIKAKSGEIKWQKNFDGANLASVSVANGVVYAAFFNGYFRALHAETGKVLFEFLTGPAAGAYGLSPYNLNIPLVTTPVISNGTIFVGGGYLFPQTLNKSIPGGLFAFGIPQRD